MLSKAAKLPIYELMDAPLLLACGPYFDETGIWVSLALFLVVKPLAYFAFIQAFRYRVNRPIPMRFGQAALLAAARAGLGLLFVGGWWWLITQSHRGELFILSWVYLYAERLFSWWIVGWRGAGLHGRRLVGWMISGTLINAAFDAAMVSGVITGWVAPTAIVVVIFLFIAALHVVGRRASLKARFDGAPRCVKCQYDLTGNLSGVCPECGTMIALPATA